MPARSIWHGAAPNLPLVKDNPVIRQEKIYRAEAKGGGRTTSPLTTAPTLTIRPWNAVGGCQACEPPMLSGRCHHERHRDAAGHKASQGRASPATRGTCRPFPCPPKGAGKQAGPPSISGLPQSPAPGRCRSLAPKETGYPSREHCSHLPCTSRCASEVQRRMPRAGNSGITFGIGRQCRPHATRKQLPRAFRIPTALVM